MDEKHDKTYRTLTGQKTTFSKCPVLDEKPHDFTILAYLPEIGLQVLCRHCLLSATFTLTDDEPAASPLAN